MILFKTVRERFYYICLLFKMNFYLIRAKFYPYNKAGEQGKGKKSLEKTSMLNRNKHLPISDWFCATRQLCKCANVFFHEKNTL